jgi:undecaprenyl-diphosphatase
VSAPPSRPLSGLTSADRHLERWFVHHREGWLNPVFEALSWAGRLGLIWIVIACVLALLWKRYALVVVTVVAVAVSDWAAYGLKAVFDVERPSMRYADPKPLVTPPHDGSFPSGHAATSFAAATVLTFARPGWAPAFYLLALAIGFSRVYVGVHYPLDVVGGAVLGIAVAIALRLLVKVQPRLRAGRRGAR